MTRLVIVVLFAFGSALAKSYYYPEIRTRLVLSGDGNVRVLQQRTYGFSGAYSWAFVDLRKQGADDIVFNGLAELGPNGWRDVEPVEVGNSSQSLYIRWEYSAVDEQRSFRLDYTLLGAVRRHADCAEFHWKAVEDEHERVSRSVIEVVPPAPSPGLFKVFVHSRARPGRLVFAADRSLVTVEQRDVPRNAFVEVRVLLDADLFAGLAADSTSVHARILAEERRSYIVSSLLPALLVPLAGLLLVVLPVLILILGYIRHGREPKLDYDAVYEREPPRAAPPAVVPLIMVQWPDKTTSSQALLEALFGNLLALAMRGAVTVAEVRDGGKTRYLFRLVHRELVQGGDQFDRQTVDFFFGRVAAGRTEFDDATLKRYVREHPADARATVGEVFDAGMEWWRRALGSELVEPASYRAYRRFARVAAVLPLAGGACLGAGLATLGVGSVGGGLVFGLIAGLVIAGLYLVLGSSIRRWSPAAHLEHRRWSLFRRFLRDFSAIEQAPPSLLAIWEHYYIYAVALGVAEEFLRHIVQLAEVRGSAFNLPVWYSAAAGSAAPGGGVAGTGLVGFAAFANNVSGMVAAFSATTSSGGGFSGGGGRGGGGGSSGAG